MPEAFICSYVRTPIGRFGGALSSVRTDDLAAAPIKALVELCKPAKNRQHQAAMRGRAVGPNVAKRAESGSSLGDLCERIEKIAA